MQNKFVKLPIIFILLFAFQGVAQTTEKSKHPLLDKYYPRADNTDTSKAITSQIKTISETKPSAGVTTVPAVATAPSVNPTTLTSVTTQPGVSTTPAISDTTAINKPSTVVVPPPVQKVHTQPPPPLMDTRLGSSTKQYDTWEKNNNGAGSVTTSPK